LIWNPDTLRFFCQVCQFGVQIEEEDKPYAEQYIKTIDGHSTRNKNSRVDNSRMKLRPIKAVAEDNVRRYPRKADRSSDDYDLKRLRDIGANIISEKEVMP
jgi:hypothetical protein